MEQKKLLWIIFSVALFLLVVIGVGIIWFYPSTGAKSPTGDPGFAGVSSEEEFDPIEWVRQDEAYPGLEEKEDADTKGEEESEDFIVVYGESEEEAKAAEEREPAKREKTVTPETVREKKEKQEPVEEKTAAAAKPAREKEPEPKMVRVPEYWIQTGSYTSKTRAEQVKGALMEKGVASLITSKSIDTTTYFRVRIGPYSTKGEAEKFLSWIRSINGFSGSYISLVYTDKRQLN
jgi:cell division protein FtsN